MTHVRAGLLILIITVLLLGAVEGALRLGGGGGHERLFKPLPDTSSPVMVSNKAFYQQFFALPVENLINWDDLECVFPPGKGEKTFRVFVLGSSAASGVPPDAAYGFWRVLEVMLRERFPEVEFEVLSLACPGTNSHVMRAAVAECAAMKPDLFLAYMGNNEFVGPFGAGSTVGRGKPMPYPMIRASLFLRDSGIYRLVAGNRFRERTTVVVSEEDVWRYLQPLDPEGPLAAQILDNFGKNLESMASIAHEAGAELVLGTVGCNLRSWAPIQSRRDASLPEAQKMEWDTACQRGVEASTRGDYETAAEYFRRATEIDGGHAETWFNLGRSLFALGRGDEALGPFKNARDCDWVMGRATGAVNGHIQGAGVLPGVTLVDAEKELIARSSGGVPGNDLFYDNVHLNFAGGKALAAAFYPAVAGAVARKFPELSVAGRETPPDDALIGARLAMTPQAECDHIDRILAMLPVFKKGITATWDESIGMLAKRREAVASSPGCGAEAAVVALREALAANPKDAVLADRLLDRLSQGGDRDSYLETARKMVEGIPARRPLLRHLANALRECGRTDEAFAAYARLLDCFPDDTEGWCGRAAIELLRGDSTAAVRSCRRAVLANPAHLGAQLGLAEALAAAGRRDEALEEYDTAVLMNPMNPKPMESMETWLTGAFTPEERAEIWDGLVSRAPRAPLPLVFLAAARQSSTRPEDAAASAAKALDLGLDGAGLPYYKALALRLAGHAGEAESAYQEAVAAAPEDFRPSRDLDMMLSSRPAGDRAAVWRGLVGKAPASARSWFYLAQALEQSGDLPGAENAFARAHGLNPEDPAMAAGLGRVRVSLEKYGEAQAPLEAALAVNDEIIQARHDLVKTLAALGDCAGARRELERCAADARGALSAFVADRCGQ